MVVVDMTQVRFCTMNVTTAAKRMDAIAEYMQARNMNLLALQGTRILVDSQVSIQERMRSRGYNYIGGKSIMTAGGRGMALPLLPASMRSGSRSDPSS